MITRTAIILIACAVVFPSGALGQDALDPPQSFPFEGGTLTIVQTEDYDRVLDFDGKELARNFDLSLSRMAAVGGVNVALFAVGDGGNMCPPATLIVWKPEGSEVETQTVGEDCGSPSPAVADNDIYFVPYLLPGASESVQAWSPTEGLRTMGRLTYTPEPGTSWADLDPSKFDNIIDSLRNEAVYAASEKLLGDQLTSVVTGLLVGGGTESTPSGAFYSNGCVPHNCGGTNTFMGVDAAAGKVYFAQQSDSPEPNAWPAVENWPADLREAMQASMEGG